MVRAFTPSALFFTFWHDAQDLAAKLGVGEPLPHGVDLSSRVRYRFGAEESGVLEALDRGLELNPGLLAGGDETAVGVQPGDALEGDPEQSGVVESQAPDGSVPIAMRSAAGSSLWGRRSISS